MKANKYLFTVRNANFATTLAVIVLADEKIYTEILMEDMFRNNMDCGCFVEYVQSGSVTEQRHASNRLINEIGAIHVWPSKFVEIEQEGRFERVRKAFAVANAMIARG